MSKLLPGNNNGQGGPAQAARKAPVATSNPQFQPYSILRSMWKQKWAAAVPKRVVYWDSQETVEIAGLCVGCDVNGTSRPVALAEAKPVGFAVGGEGEDRVAGQQAVGSTKIPRWRTRL